MPGRALTVLAGAVRAARLAAVLAAVASLPAAAPALARQDVVATVPSAGPLLSGSHLVYTRPDDAGGEEEPDLAVVAARAGSRPRTVATVTKVAGFDRVSLLGFAASSRLVAYATFVGGNQYGFFTQSASAGPLAGPIVGLGSGGDQSCALPAGDVDAGGYVAAWTEAPGSPAPSAPSACPAPGYRVLARDLSAGDSQGRVLAVASTFLGDVRTAGRFTAWRQGSPPAIVVHDRDAGAEAYRIDQSGADRLTSYDLQADGKVAGTLAGGGAGAPAAVAWFSPAERTAHRLALGATSAVVLAGDSIAFRRSAAGGSELAVSDLAGRTHAVVSFSRPELQVGGFDFDGGRMAFGRRECAGPVLAIERADGTGASVPDGPLSCEARVPGAVTAKRSGWVRIPVGCPRGCRGTVALRFGDLVVERRLRALRGHVPVRFRLRAAERRRLRAAGALHGRATVRLADRLGRSHAARSAIDVVSP
ncbi:MAG TPA: hypothetical protein VF520_16235 [Thermoleophilaceae bacterium]|jgi:hypothetical protein